MQRLIEISAVVGLLVGGCSSRPPRVVPPAIDPEAIVERVMEAADQNDDGLLENDELETIPGIAYAKQRFDADADKAVSRVELVNWLTSIKNSKIGMVSPIVLIRHRGKPLVGAGVQFVPDDVMGGVIQPAQGTTEDDGGVVLAVRSSRVPGVHCGLYRVEVTGNGNDGKPLPAEFNSATKLGVAIGGSAGGSSTIVLTLD